MEPSRFLLWLPKATSGVPEFSRQAGERIARIARASLAIGAKGGLCFQKRYKFAPKMMVSVLPPTMHKSRHRCRGGRRAESRIDAK